MEQSVGTARVIAVGIPQTFRQQVVRALETEPEQVGWVPSVTAAEAFLTDHPDVANVVVLSPGVKDADAIGLAEFLGRTSPVTAVVLCRDQTPKNGLLPAAMRAGIRDVVDLSRGGHDLQEALNRAIAWSANLMSARPSRSAEAPGIRGTIVSVFSSKGGTGKTFLTCNLAGALSRRSGQDTAVVDLDLELGDVMAYFGLEASRQTQDMVAVRELTDPEDIRRAGTKLDDHLWAYAAPSGPGALPNISGETIGQMLRNLRSVFSYVVIDASANYSDFALAAFDLSDAICLVSGLDVVGVRHLSMAMETLSALGLPRDRFRVVMNRSDSKVGLAPEEVERVMKIKADAMIPSSRLVPTSLNTGRPIYSSEPRSGVAQAVDALAAKIMSLSTTSAKEASEGFTAQPSKRGRFSRR
jgi:pilus assembly protein CpaE